ncbi:MAG: hypothetical protein NVSMB68_02710 [Thermoanaerobaculia bacterium]
MEKRTARRLRGALLTIGGGFALIEILAWTNVHHERQRRAYLDGHLFSVTEGRGDPIVFIPGLQASTRYWGSAFQELATDHRLIYVDALGFGQSPWPIHEPTLDDHLASIRQTLLALDAKSHITIVAHSFGTILAAYYAARFPAEVDRVVLLGTPVFHDARDARSRIREMSSFGALFSLNPFFAREGCLLMGAVRPLLYRVLPYLDRNLPAAVVQDSVLHDWPAINGAIQNILLRQPIEPALRQLGARVTLVHGASDSVTPMETMRSVAAKTGARLLVIDGTHQDYVTRGRATVLTAIRSAPRK